ncbi:recombinase family protein [Streptomyces decoyicus]|uniref:recombinase family protein n=1 Tax=Streptomyces decoyicus TaxID=249567 RepID=UPI00363C14B3
MSSDRFGLETGVDRQLEDAEDSRARLRWAPLAKIYRENDTSAFKKRKVIKPDGSIDWIVLRPEFRQILADLANGVIDGVIFYDLDRLVRQPRDLEDLIDIVEYVKRPVTGATGGRMNLLSTLLGAAAAPVGLNDLAHDDAESLGRSQKHCWLR